MILTEGEKLHPLWLKLLDYFDERLESNRVALEIEPDEKKADKYRGRIAEVKLFKSLNDQIEDTVPNVEV